MKNIILCIMFIFVCSFAATWQDDFSFSTSNWSTIYSASNMTVSGGTFNATTSNSRNAAYYNASDSSDTMLVTSKINYTTNVSQTMVCARVKKTSQTFYYFGFYTDNTSWRIGRFVNGTNTTILSGSRSAIASGSTFGIRVWSDTIVGYINGVAIDTAIDANITGYGYGGLYVYYGTTYGNFDDFSMSFDIKKVAASIITHPRDTTVPEYSGAFFSIYAIGTSLTYQWIRNGTNVGTNNSIYSFSPTLSNNGDSIWCTVIADTGNLVTSNKAYLTVTEYDGPFYDSSSIEGDVNSKKIPATVVVHPVNDSVAAGEISYFTVQATGTTCTYQWVRNNVNVGSNSNIYSFTTSSANNSDSVWCVVSADTGNAATSTKAYLEVTGTSNLPVITDQPDDYNQDEGGMAIFDIAATFDGTITYQWYRNDSLLAGATNSTLLMTNIGRHLNNASVYCMVNGTVKSNTVHLTVNYITTQPQNQTVTEGQTVTFTVSGNGLSSYHWFRNDSLKSTSSSYSFTVTQNLNEAKIYCLVNTLLTTDTVYLTVNPVPATMITSQPHDTTVTAGTTATFRITATPTPTKYQWYGNNVAISEATGSIYTFTTSYSLNGSTIFCVINDTLYSDTVTLTVLEPFTLLENVDTLKLVYKALNATGYQWYRNNSIMNGETDSVLTILADSLFYNSKYIIYCIASNEVNSLKSNEWIFKFGVDNKQSGILRGTWLGIWNRIIR